jgi:flagellar protein FlgJ
MRHAEFSTAPLAPLAPTAPTRPAQALGGGSGFGRVFSELQGEVADFIRNGDSGGLGMTHSARALQAQVQAAGAAQASGTETGTASQQAFLDSIAPWAREAGEKLGVAPELVSAHAALESGWGQRPLANQGGASSNNLFGVKAGPGWNGAVAESATTEYVQGAAIKTSARFRAYPDQASAFRDYAQMLLENPRFRGALGAGNDAHAFAQGLAKGGYATDPNYAAKLQGVAARLQGVSG